MHETWTREERVPTFLKYTTFLPLSNKSVWLSMRFRIKQTMGWIVVPISVQYLTVKEKLWRYCARDTSLWLAPDSDGVLSVQKFVRNSKKNDQQMQSKRLHSPPSARKLLSRRDKGWEIQRVNEWNRLCIVSINIQNLSRRQSVHPSLLFNEEQLPGEEVRKSSDPIGWSITKKLWYLQRLQELQFCFDIFSDFRVALSDSSELPRDDH